MPYGQLFDSVEVEAIPADAKQVAGYVDGAYRNIDELKRRFPHAQHLGITVTGDDLAADAIDVEQGNVQPPKAALWVARKLHLRTRPRYYTSRSNWGACIDALGVAGVPAGKVWWWIADWTGHAHSLNGAACVQYASPTLGLPPGHHYDVSQVLYARFMPQRSR